MQSKANIYINIIYFIELDPFLEIFGTPPHQNVKSLIYRTKYIPNELNPVWEEIVIQVDTCGGLDAPLLLKVTDHDNDGTHDFIGQVPTTLRELSFPSPKLSLQNRKKQGNIFYRNSGIITCVLTPHTPDYSEYSIVSFSMRCSGKKLDRKDMMGLGKSDPYFIIKRESDSVEVYHSEIIKSKLNPDWDPFQLSVQACHGLDSALIVEVWDWDRVTKDDFIGKFKTTLRGLFLFSKDPQFPLINPSKVGNLTYRTSGFFVVREMNPHYAPPQQQQHHPGLGREGSFAYSSQQQQSHFPNPNVRMPSQQALFPSTSDPHVNAMESSQSVLYPTVSEPAIPQHNQNHQHHQHQNSNNYHNNQSNSNNYSNNNNNNSNIHNQNNNNYSNQSPPSYYTNNDSNYNANPPSYSSNLGNSNLPSYITGIPEQKKPEQKIQPSVNDLYSSCSSYTPDNPPAYLSNVSSTPNSNQYQYGNQNHQNQNQNQYQNQSQNQNRPSSSANRPHGYI